MNVNVDESLYTHFESSTPLHQKAVQDLMTFTLLQDIIDKHLDVL
jgi:hypothetical protein